MGYLAEYARRGRKTFPGATTGRETWQRVFGATNKEEGLSARQIRQTGQSHARSSLGTDASTIRLLQALRSMAPGGWSDDRWEQSKHFLGIVFVAVDRLCRQLSQAEFQVYKRDRNHQDGKRPVTPDDPPEGDRWPTRPYDLVKLLQRPNRRDHFGRMMYRWGQQLKLTGKALTWMVPNKGGVPCELYCIPTALAIPQPAINPDYPDGFYRIQPVYPYGPFSSYPTPASAVGAPIPSQWMMEFQYPHPLLRYDGFSPLTGGRLQIDEVEQMDKSRWYVTKRLFSPNAVLNPDGAEGVNPLPDEEIERIKAEFENELQGAENAGKLLVSSPGYKFEPWESNLKDLEFKDGWTQLVEFVLGGIFGITKEASGMLGTANYAVLWAALKQLYVTTLQPDCNDIGADVTHTLGHFFGDDLVVEVKCPRIDDEEQKGNKYRLLMEAKALTKNEMRKAFEEPTTEEPWGEEIAGFEPQQAPEGMGMPGPGGPVPQGSPQKVAPNPLKAQEPKSEDANQRPSAGPLAAGSLGPKTKSLPTPIIIRKSLSRLSRNGAGVFHSRPVTVIRQGTEQSQKDLGTDDGEGVLEAYRAFAKLLNGSNGHLSNGKHTGL